MLYFTTLSYTLYLFQAGANCATGNTKVFRWNLGYEMVKFELTGGL